MVWVRQPESEPQGGGRGGWLIKWACFWPTQDLKFGILGGWGPKSASRLVPCTPTTPECDDHSGASGRPGWGRWSGMTHSLTGAPGWEEARSRKGEGAEASQAPEEMDWRWEPGAGGRDGVSGHTGHDGSGSCPVLCPSQASPRPAHLFPRNSPSGRWTGLSLFC